MATIKEIAELAGVSRGTVDRVLNNRGSVNPRTARKILGSELYLAGNFARCTIVHNGSAAAPLYKAEGNFCGIRAGFQMQIGPKEKVALCAIRAQQGRIFRYIVVA